MRPHFCLFLTGLFIVGSFAGLSLAEPVPEGYTPVTPPATVNAAVRDSLKTVEDWLDRKDFLSAAQYTQSLSALAQLYAHQGNDKAWREKTTSLADACSRLGSAARNKDATACAKLVQECNRLLDELAKIAPGERIADKKFKPNGSNKTWMLLMEEAVSEGLTAKKPAEAEQWAGALAEEANAMQFMRADARWQKSFQEVVAAALEATDKAKAKDVDGAKLAFKTAYKSCEACHKTSRR